MRRADETPRAALVPELGAVTLTLPLAALGPLPPFQLPPPALVSPDVNAAHVGLSRNGLADVLRAMRDDRTFGPRVIVLSRKRLAAAPEDVIAFMRQRYGATCAPTVAPMDEIAALQAELEAELGIIDTPRAPSRGRRAK